MTHLQPPKIQHVALTVTDLEVSIEFYSRLFGVPPAHTGEMLAGTPHHYRLAVWRQPNFGLHHFGEQGSFNERHPGLDHLAFHCSDQADFDARVAHLDAVNIERADVLVEPYGSGVAFRDPDNIALEFFLNARPPV